MKRIVKMLIMLTIALSLTILLMPHYTSAQTVQNTTNKAYKEISDEGFIVKDGVLEKYTGSSQYVELPEGIHTIGTYAFAGNHTIKNVTFHQV